MLEILPINHLRDEEGLIFGNLNVLLSKLFHLKIPVAQGIIVVPHNFKLRTVLEHYDFGSKEIFEQSLTLAKKELHSIPVPQNLVTELKGHSNFFTEGEELRNVKDIWKVLIDAWFEQIKIKLWNEGFNKGITENLEPKKIIFVKKVSSFGVAEFNKKQADVSLKIKSGQISPSQAKNLEELIKSADRKLIVSYLYEWIIDQDKIFISDIKPYTPVTTSQIIREDSQTSQVSKPQTKSTLKVLLNLSSSKIRIDDFSNTDVDGVILLGEKILKNEVVKEDLENLMLKLLDSANLFSNKPILFKLPDFSEGMGQVRGAQRLIHNPQVLNAILEAVVYARFKHQRFLESGKVYGHSNIHLVVPFVRGVNELLEIKREMAIKKLIRRNSLQIWLELATPENFINLEEYLLGGLDGVIINLDEVLSHLLGFDHTLDELTFYKKQVSSLIKFLEDGVRMLHKSKVPFLVSGNLTHEVEVIEFLVTKGVTGIVVQPFDVDSIHELLMKSEKKMVIQRSSALT